MIINNNLSAMNAHRQLGINQNHMQNSMEKLSSGQRINQASDDAAGLAISEKMRAQINGLDQASRNAQDGISLIQTAEGALDETHSILQRMRELTVQAANDTNEDVDREAIASELTELAAEIDRIADNTEFNGKTLLDGTFETDEINLQIGANQDQNLQLNIDNMTADGLGLGAAGEDLDVSAHTEAGATLVLLDTAIENVSKQRSELGAVQNRLEHTISNLNNASENLTAAESRIRDVDMAQEMMEFTKNNILNQASQSMLAQANQLPQQVLQLLG
ncbi:flagellin [Alteribacter lacisalsi]|uniref:Flagellin n=1 Tax=Alteribacter lacisalsi TaxID=2045244 RepID=A0A2W0H5F4_9BACI|nr:flagellin [Alteribacter lacisalsi]PYZ95846.1 flagellin [Alteribacter lacisalsi]